MIKVQLSETASAADNKVAILDVRDFMKNRNRGGVMTFPDGSFNVDSEVDLDFNNITASGAGECATYGETFVAGTHLKFTAGAYGFGLTHIDAYGGGSYGALKNVALDGMGVCNEGVRVKGTVGLKSLQAANFRNAGIHLTGLVNSSSLSGVCCVKNTAGNGYGLWVDGLSNTAFYVENCRFRQNKCGVVLITGRNISVRNSVSESNQYEGLSIWKPSGVELGYIDFENFWLENNNAGTANYQAVINSQDHDLSSGPPSYISFRRCMFNAPNGARHLNVIAGRLVRDEWCHFAGGDQANAIHRGEWSYGCESVDRNGGQIVDNGYLNFETRVNLTDYGSPWKGGHKTDTAYIAHVKS